MDQPEAVVEEQPAPPPVVAHAPAPGKIRYRDRLTLYELFHLYEFGRKVFGKAEREHWVVALSVAASSKGVLLGERDGATVLLGVFWLTDNPNETTQHWPLYAEDGNFVYVAWLFNEAGEDAVKDFRDFLRQEFPQAKYLAHHEARKGRKREVVVMRLHQPEGENGHG